MKQTKILLLYIFSLAMVSCKSNPEPPSNPNIVFILVDDLGYNDVSFMGSEFYETPNIDKVASKGMIFTNGYANSAVCSPSRASLMTGRFTAVHGITDWIGAPQGEAWRSYKRYSKLLPAEYNHQLSKEITTLPEALKQEGYKTFFAGKWHLGSAEENSLPTDHGFDINKGGYHVGGPYSGGYFSPFENPFMEDFEEEKGISLSMKLAKETNLFIEQNKEEKFLAYLSFYAVHAPIQTSKEKWSKYRNKAEAMGIDSTGFEMERVLPARKYQDNPVYAGLIEQMDEAVGAVVDQLEKLGLSENTIIVFTSDNGGVVSGDNYSTNLDPLRGGKGYQWEGGTRIPYMIYVPWLENNGQRNDTPVSGVDFYPTLLDFAGVNEISQPLDGQSIRPVLEGGTLEERSIYWHYPHYGNQGGEPNSSIRKGDWKLIHYWEDGHEELYNLGNDLGEVNDLIKENPEIASSLSKELLGWLDSNQANYAHIDPLYNPDSAAIVLENYKTNLIQRLENQRKNMLSKTFQPNKDWWGSKTVD
ncbi:sulfatase [Algoriphagus machipongonensis]|uniref:Sulfatase family protein n=1 Tax=Algoriphagus machipongonensis TaxID=388413 RepID=A3I2P0_9BACT|nr:sulfatase [Algoriphagus machipongonensis]EAZ79344.1 sulfatase family protein [Algoriphagus machipongonensis]